jgi:hypothetical protein
MAVLKHLAGRASASQDEHYKKQDNSYSLCGPGGWQDGAQKKPKRGKTESC